MEIYHRGLLVKVHYHTNRDRVALSDFTSPAFTIDTSKTDSNSNVVSLVFRWSNVTLFAEDDYFFALIMPIGGTYHTTQLDLNASGYTAATFLYPTDENLSIGKLKLQVIPGIPDRNFNVLTNRGKFEHQFVYMPIKSAIGRIWLNNNLGAQYADLNSPDFNSKQQARSVTDHKAYGSIFQWGRKADGHELINWTDNNGTIKGTPKYGTTTKKSDDPSSVYPPDPRFIIGG